MKKIQAITLSGLFVLFLFSCSTATVKKETVKDPVTQTVIAIVVDQKGVLVGEYKEGSKIIDKNITDKIITWEGFSLILRTESGETYEYLSAEPFYAGDRVMIRIQDGKVISVKFSP